VLWLTFRALPDAGSVESFLVATGEVPSVAFDLWIGAIWAGVVIGLLNLLPLWPLDGGHLVDSVFTSTLGARRGRRLMLISTLAMVGVISALGLAAQGVEGPTNGLERMVVEARLAPLAGLTESSFGAALWEQVRTFPGTVLDFPFLLLIFCGLNAFMSLRALSAKQPFVAWRDLRLGDAPARGDGPGRSRRPGQDGGEGIVPDSPRD
jgi:Zn-dependent protease